MYLQPFLFVMLSALLYPKPGVTSDVCDIDASGTSYLFQAKVIDSSITERNFVYIVSSLPSVYVVLRDIID